MRSKIAEYITRWESQGYEDGIPDEVPDELMRLHLAPSYKAICFAILKNDVTLKLLGFSGTYSPWYGELKRVEIEGRRGKVQLELF